MGSNRPSFRTGHNGIAVVGTAEQCTAGVLPQGNFVVIRARSTNAGLIYIGYTKADAEANHFSLLPAGSVGLQVDNVSDVWVDAAVADDIGAGSNKFYSCGTNGEDGATIGYWIHAADITRMWDCVSSGHTTAGFQIDIGTDHCLIKDCASGGGDGRRIDNGDHNMWPNFIDTLRRENHVHIYPFPDGEGTAGSPIAITTDAQDETNGAASTADYYGEPKVLIAPEVVTNRWDYICNNIYATTTNKEFRGSVYRIVNLIRAARDAGNAWDEGATVLTFDDASDFAAGDLIWITSSAYKPNGEIVRITDVTGAVVTIERETSQFGAPNTGLRWNHSTNVGAGTLYAYLCWRDEPQYHAAEFDYSAGSAKNFRSFNFPYPRGLNPNCGLIVRLQNSTDGTNGAGLSMTICYKD